jgi:hypothetical protein
MDANVWDWALWKLIGQPMIQAILNGASFEPVEDELCLGIQWQERDIVTGDGQVLQHPLWKPMDKASLYTAFYRLVAELRETMEEEDPQWIVQVILVPAMISLLSATQAMFAKPLYNADHGTQYGKEFSALEPLFLPWDVKWMTPKCIRSFQGNAGEVDVGSLS